MIWFAIPPIITKMRKRIARKKHNEMVDTIKLVLGVVAVALFGAAAIALAIMYASK